MQHYPMHAEGTSFVQPNEARHIQTSVSGIRQKNRRTFPARDEHLSGVAGTGARRALTANKGLTRGRLHFHDKWSWRAASPPCMKIVPSFRRKPESSSAIAGFRDVLDPGFRRGDVLA